MVELPAETPTIAPVAALMVATAGLEEVQVPPKTVEAKVTESPMQMFCVPDKVPAETGAVMVTPVVATTFGQPPTPVMVYVTVYGPGVEVLGLISPEAALIESPAGAEKVPPEKLPVPVKVTL
jgi:hypothetical protein